jgi:C1A family cysteine protease
MLGLFVRLLPFSNVDNFFFIKEHNSKNLSYTVGSNEFIHQNYTDEFFVGENHLISNEPVEDLLSFSEEQTIPSKFDWRNEYKVSSVKNQGSCGACWAFSASEATEGAWAIKHNVLYNLSQQELVDCSDQNKGCNGGSMDLAFNYIINNGLCTNLSYPYVAEQHKCQKGQCDPVVKLTNYSDIVPNNEKILKRAVYQQPVSVAIQANKRSFQLYQSGIYSDLNCGTELDHGVLLVGYGHDFMNDMDYWIIKNSWGPLWGEKGYIRILRNIQDDRGLCGVAMQPSIPIV